METVFWDRKGVLMVEFTQQETTETSDVYYETLKNCVGPYSIKGVECSYMTLRFRIQLLALDHSWSISIVSCLTTLLTALISLRATTTCLLMPT
jgi:hypothetical protein